MKSRFHISEREMTFEYESDRIPFMIRQHAALYCRVTFITFTHVVTTQLSIYDESDSYIVTTSHDAFPKEYRSKLDAKIELYMSGIITFYCSWTYSVNWGGSKLMHTIVKNVNITVHSKFQISTVIVIEPT